MAWLEYLVWVSVGLLTLWLVSRIDDWLIAREQRNAAKYK